VHIGVYKYPTDRLGADLVYFSHMTDFSQVLQEAADKIATGDPVLAGVIAQVGRCTIRPHTNYYQELVQSILGQQLSLKAAAAIEARFIVLFEGVFPSPAQILGKDPDELRSVGLSRAKAVYVQDLAQHIIDGRIAFDRLDQQSNEEITAELTAVKGIGEWTVHMFLMFAMGRLDILPVGDLGIKNGIRKLYGLSEQPAPQAISAIAEANHWHPYETVASWYVWQSLNLPA
jgi:DNA-3-methyladenine glycosylase II